jgi:hypothetical protein
MPVTRGDRKPGFDHAARAVVLVERIVAAIEDRLVEHKRGDYLGKVMCFFEVGDGKGTLLQLGVEYNAHAVESILGARPQSQHRPRLSTEEPSSSTAMRWCHLCVYRSPIRAISIDIKRRVPRQFRQPV